MSQPHNWEDTLRIHDVAFYNWLEGMHVDYNFKWGDALTVSQEDVSILAVFASPSRAFAPLVNTLVSRGFIPSSAAPTPEAMRDLADDAFNVMPLPVATFLRGDPQLDPEIRGVPMRWRSLQLDRSTANWMIHQQPAHYRIPYTVTFWCDKRYSEAYIWEWIQAQLGHLGCQDNEALISVTHREPWGELLQSLRYEGSADQSYLEGEKPRYSRIEYTFSLRAWFFKNLDSEATLVDTTQVDGEIVEGVIADYDIQGRRQSNNLFTIPIPVNRVSLWPRTGDADVAIGAPPDEWEFQAKVTVATDRVELAERFAFRDSDDIQLLGASFEYQATDDVLLRLNQTDPDNSDATTGADALMLPATLGERWNKVHWFSVVRQKLFSYWIGGVPPSPEQTVNLKGIDIRRISSLVKLLPSDTIDVGAAYRYEWRGLDRRPYLIVALITSTSGGANVLTAEDDAGLPSYTVHRTVDAYVNTGAVILMEPKRNTLVLTVPKTIGTDAIFIQYYDGPFNGHTV